MANPSLQIGDSNWAIKEDNLLGYSTAGTRFVPQPITMTRASAGTRVNSSGLVETVELLGSELVDCADFSCAVPLDYWTVYGDTEISNGKANLNSGTGAFANTLLQSSVVTNLKNYKISFTISNYQEGEAYVSIGFNTSLVVNADGDYTFYGVSQSGDNTNFLIRNGTANFIGSITNISIKESTKNNLARVDYDGTASSLLVEPERTNLFPYSEDFSNTAWSKFRSSLTINQTTSPDGTINAYLIEQDYPNTSVHGGLADSITMTSGVEYTYSFFIKKKEYSWIELAEAATSAANTSTWFDIENGVVGIVGAGSTAQIKDFGNGWYRCSISFTSLNTSSRNLTLYLARGDGSTTADFEGGVYFWGAQLEAGSYATSYIPTDGGTVTRVADQYSKTGISNLINSEEGVLFVEMAALSDDGTDRRITLSDGSVSDQVIIGLSRFASNINAEIHSSGVLQTSGWGGTGVTQTNNNKFALSWGSGTMKFYINGSPTSPQTGVTSPIGLNSLKFSIGNDTLNMFAKVKQLQVFKTALTDPELIALTTI